jgi:hypothetical protein
MLEQYFIKPETIDRLHGSWLSEEIDTYVSALVERGYRWRTRQRGSHGGGPARSRRRIRG